MSDFISHRPQLALLVPHDSRVFKRMPSSARTVQGLSYFCHIADYPMQNLHTAAEATHGAGLAQALRKGLEANDQGQGGRNSYKPTAQNESLISLFPSE